MTLSEVQLTDAPQLRRQQSGDPGTRPGGTPALGFFRRFIHDGVVIFWPRPTGALTVQRAPAPRRLARGRTAWAPARAERDQRSPYEEDLVFVYLRHSRHLHFSVGELTEPTASACERMSGCPNMLRLHRLLVRVEAISGAVPAVKCEPHRAHIASPARPAWQGRPWPALARRRPWWRTVSMPEGTRAQRGAHG